MTNKHRKKIILTYGNKNQNIKVMFKILTVHIITPNDNYTVKV